MRKIMVYLILVGLVSSVTCLKMKEIGKLIVDLIPATPLDGFLRQQKKDIAETVKHGVKTAKKMVEDVAIPISELPLYHYRAENKIYGLSDLKKHGDEFLIAKYTPGIWLQRQAQRFGFYDMVDVKHVVCEFFYNAAEITFYRGTKNFSEEILKEVEKLGVLKPEDIETLEQLGMSKKDQNLSTWYWTDKYQKLVPLLGEAKGKPGNGDGYSLLSKEKVAIKKKYHKLTNDIATLVWHLFFTYQDDYAPRENIVHQHLKREQIRGHLMGNAFVLSMLNDTMKFYRIKQIYLGSDSIDTDLLKKEVRAFVEEIGYIYTRGEVDPFEKESFRLIKKVVRWLLNKLGIIKVPSDMQVLYKFKIEVLVVLKRILSKSELDEKKAIKIIELCINHWKIVFYLHVSGTMTSTKPAPEFYNYHETEEEKDSAITSDSDTVERDKSSLDSLETTNSDKPGSPRNVDAEDLENLSDFGNRVLEEKDKIAKLLEDQNPFQELLQQSLIKLDLNFRVIREQLIISLQIICDHLLLKNDCDFIKQSIKNINTYLLIEDDRIASRKWCYEHLDDCYKIEPTKYMLFIRKMTEVQGVSMGIIEYFILKCKQMKSLKHLSKEGRIKLRKDIKSVFKEYYFLRIFITREYRKALTDYALGYKNSNIVKLASARVKQIKKGIGLVPKKPARLDPRDMDVILIPENSDKN